MVQSPDTSSALYETIVQAVKNHEIFLRLTATGTVAKKTHPWKKAVVRLIMLRGETHWQFTWFDERKAQTQNFRADELEKPLAELVQTPFRNFHVQTTGEDLHLRVSKKGKTFLTRGKPSADPSSIDRSHDRTKTYPIPEEGAEVLWRAIDITDETGVVKPTKRHKFLQVNEFIKLMSESCKNFPETKTPLRIVDCGCGNAYLTFAAYYYFTEIVGRSVKVTGVDSNEEIIEHCNQIRDDLGWVSMEFQVSSIKDYEPAKPPDMVLSLHACDTATDEAIAQAVEWNSTVILAAPCCQHELRNQIQSDLHEPLLRHGILKQKTADLLTDACRAQILRVLGYQTDVVQFIDSTHTPKNLMIRAHKSTAIDVAKAAIDYRELVSFWHIRPALEVYLKGRLEPFTIR